MYSDEIVRLRGEKGWSQDELAHRAGVHRNTIVKAETPAEGLPDEHLRLYRTTAHKIAVALGVHDEEITMSEASLRIEHGSEKELIEWLKKRLPDGFKIIRSRKGSTIVDLILTPRNVARLKEAIDRNELAEFGHVEFKLLEADEENGLDAIEDVDQQGSEVSNGRAGRPVRIISWKTMAAWLAIAASLLFCGVMLGRTVFRAPDPDGFDVLVGSASTSLLPIRGPNDQSPHLEIRSPISGFVTVISLAPDRRPLVYPRTGGTDFRVRDGVSTEPHQLPDDTTAVVYVVTKTPASHTVRRLEEDIRDLRPGDESQIQSSLEALLKEYGFGRVAIGTATFEKE